MAHSPQPRIQRPALMLLTSHRMDCFELCVWCLERFTRLERFTAVYVLANAVSPEHEAAIAAFAERHAHVRVVPCLPKGLVPAVMEAQNAILTRHADRSCPRPPDGGHEGGVDLTEQHHGCDADRLGIGHSQAVDETRRLAQALHHP